MSEHTKERLKELQALPLERKVGFTAARIIEWYSHHKGKVYISFSGGKDSRVLLYIARKLYPEIKACFINTGLEYPEIVEFVKTFENVDIIKPKMSFKQVIEKYGFPVISKEVSQCIYEGRNCPNGVQASRFDPLSEKSKSFGGRFSLAKWKFLFDSKIPISSKCCNVMKKDPAKMYEKETSLSPIIATMTEESALRKSAWIKNGCNAFNVKRPVSNPMSFWTEQNVLEFIKLKNIPICSVYGDILQNKNGKYYTTKCDRTGCMFCLYGITHDKNQNRIQRMAKTHPKIWKYCLEVLKMKEVLDFIKIPYNPDDEFDFSCDCNNCSTQSELFTEGNNDY